MRTMYPWQTLPDHIRRGLPDITEEEVRYALIEAWEDTRWKYDKHSSLLAVCPYAPGTDGFECYVGHLQGIRSWLLSDRRIVEISEECVWRLTDRPPQFSRLPDPFPAPFELTGTEVSLGQPRGVMFQLSPKITVGPSSHQPNDPVYEGPIFVYAECVAMQRERVERDRLGNPSPRSAQEFSDSMKDAWLNGDVESLKRLCMPSIQATIWSRFGSDEKDWQLSTMGDWRPVMFTGGNQAMETRIKFGQPQWEEVTASRGTAGGAVVGFQSDGEVFWSADDVAEEPRRMLDPENVLPPIHAKSWSRTVKAGDIQIDILALLTACVNALAAIYEEPDVVLLGLRSRKKRRRARAKTGGVRGAKRLTLSEDGTRLVQRRWITDPTSEPLELISGTGRKKPGEHYVDPHYFRPWVNVTRPHEKVLRTRTKVRRDGTEYTQYKVKRRRKGGTRGSGPLLANMQKMVAGVDDF